MILLQTCRLLVLTADEQTVSDNDAATLPSDSMTTAGVIVIAVVVCVVVTSLVWFIVIYKSRQRCRSLTAFRSADAVTACDAACHRTMSSVSDVDGSAQRLLAYASSHTDFLRTSTSTCTVSYHIMDLLCPPSVAQRRRTEQK